MIGLCGAHRTGKTTLARNFAAKNGIPFVETSVSAIWYELGYDPAQTYDFGTRLIVQEEILKRVDAKFSEYAGQEFITDRTPLDMAAYTLADAIGERVPEQCQQRMKDYLNACFEATNKRFGVICLVQPGIALKAEPGKAAMNEAYIEHLNSLLFGLMVDERVKCQHFYIPRAITGMEERMHSLTAAVGRSKERVNMDYANAARLGQVLIH